MSEYYKVTLINSFGEEEIHNRVESIDYLVGLEDNAILRVEKLIIEDKPEPNKVYALTGGAGAKCIANGITWADSVIKKVSIFEIFYTDSYGNVDKCGECEDPKKWLEENNKERYNAVSCGANVLMENDWSSDWEEHKLRKCTCIEGIEDFEFKYKGEK